MTFLIADRFSQLGDSLFIRHVTGKPGPMASAKQECEARLTYPTAEPPVARPKELSSATFSSMGSVGRATT
jgi:hypothetical protein